MKIIKLIIIAVILTILVFPAGIFIENWHPLNDLSWPMQLGNPQLNMVSNFSGPTNFKKIEGPPLTLYPDYIIYRNLFISQGFIITPNDYYKLNEGKSSYLNSSIIVADQNKLLWSFTQLNKPIFSFNYRTLALRSYGPIAYQDTIYFTGTDGYLYALTLKGDLLWEKYIGNTYFTYLFPEKNYIYLFGVNFSNFSDNRSINGESIYKIDLITQETLWNTTINIHTNSSVINNPPSYWNNELYLSLGNNLYFINSLNGRIDMKRTYTFNFTNYVIVANNALYGTTNNSVIKMDIRNGNIIWVYRIKDPAPCTVYKNVVDFATCDGYTYGLDAFTGKEIWNLQTNLRILSPLTITSNQIVYEYGEAERFLTGYSCLIAIDLNSGRVIDTYNSIEYGNVLGPDKFYDFESNIFKPWPLNYSYPLFRILIVPNNNIVTLDNTINHIFTGYISHILIWLCFTATIWSVSILFILLKKKFKS
jgi:outer membrane protein assembly factor BamB